MATLAFSAIGSAVGGSFLPAIGTLSGAALGKAAGAIAGRYVDQALFNSSGQPTISEGPRLDELNVTTSTQGSPIQRVYGAARVAGQIIWATNFEEEIITKTQSSGGSGGGKGGYSSGPKSTSIEYRYYANFAIALAEGEITRLGRVWANGNELNLSDYNYRLYEGSEAQTPDSLIEAKEGSGNTPSYKGVAYIVFERMPLAEFGNRIPQLNFEIYRSLDDFENTIKSITMIPSAGEYVYENAELLRDHGNGISTPENTHTHQGKSDWDVSLDQLQDDLKNVKNISLFVSWFGTDLRAEHCELKPAVDDRDKVIFNRSWLVSNKDRQTAKLTSLDENNRPAYGGTPSDETIISAIKDLKNRGIKVTFNPFILMDIDATNNLQDPYTGNSYQPKYPWRGRITVSPAPGEPGSPDKTSSALSQLANFIGTATPASFTTTASAVTYLGPEEWTLRRMVLHYAHLCEVAGGVDSFIIGSELKGLSTVRDENGTYPFVTELISLGADVKSILGSTTKVTYAADWSEYFGHQPNDGSGDVNFHLDSLWSSPNIDAVGIDCYWPLSDWRTGNEHLDAAQYNSIYDQNYLQGNLAGGEGFDFYYATEQDRENQNRTLITDGLGKPWTYRYKDIKSWWSNQHFNRANGAEALTPTSWIPQSKPIWFLELGCPALHLGSNQPNVFVDPKSSETGLPYHSNGGRDDYIQRSYITAFNNYFSPNAAGFIESQNPVSSQYSGRMVDPERIYVYTWDARPYPAFPANTEIWGDGENWLKGHWLTGRTGSITLNSLVSQIMHDYGFDKFQTPELEGVVSGYVIDRIMPARDALQPLELAFFFDSYESEGKIKFKHRAKSLTELTFTPDQLVEADAGKPLYELTRSQESELPRSAKISFIDGKKSYQNRTLEGQQTIGSSKRIATATLPIVLDVDQVQSLANKWVQEAWATREEGTFILPPSQLALEPTDTIYLDLNGEIKPLRITEINDQQARNMQLKSIEPQIYEDTISAASLPDNNLPQIYGPSKAAFFDFPLLTGNESPYQGFVGAFQQPWPGRVAFYRSPELSNFSLNQTTNAPAKLGTTLSDLFGGPKGRWDYANSIRVKMDAGELTSQTKSPVLGGANLAAVKHDNGLWELIQFQTATLIEKTIYELSGLLRAQAGTEDAMQSIATQGADFVLIDEALVQVEMNINEIGLEYNWRYGPAQYTLGHPSFQTNQQAFTARGLRPYSPAHIKSNAANSGDLLISWIRRSRIGGDSWGLNEIPLGEETEQYEIEIMNGNIPVRTFTTSTTQTLYSQADQISDWGGAQPSYQVRIYQISELYGRGGVAEATVVNH